jgi:hypothetical protein
VDDRSVMDFLGLLHRQVYQLELVKGSLESFRGYQLRQNRKRAVRGHYEHACCTRLCSRDTLNKHYF